MKNIEFLENKPEIGKEFGLDNIRKILSLLGNPQDSFKAIHVAGTNGKGSVCAMIAKGLEKSGFKTGLYTSPHLDKMNERIKINSIDIEDRDLDEAIGKIRKISEMHNIALTYFEYLTAAVFLYFFEQKVDYAVIEVGLGGRLDATNVVIPEICAITNISLEHTNFLGNTLSDVAKEKAEIIKKGADCFTRAEGEALTVIEDKCKSEGARIFIPEDIGYESSLKGSFQKANISMAAAILRKLNIDEDMIKEALIKVKWPGRFEFISDNILLDSAHNAAGIDALVKSIKDLDYKNLILVFGVMEDKDIASMTGKLGSVTDKAILTKPSMERAADPSSFSDSFKNKIIIPDVKEALAAARQIAGKNDLILVTGSIFTVAEARRSFVK